MQSVYLLEYSPDTSKHPVLLSFLWPSPFFLIHVLRPSTVMLRVALRQKYLSKKKKNSEYPMNELRREWSHHSTWFTDKRNISGSKARPRACSNRSKQGRDSTRHHCLLCFFLPYLSAPSSCSMMEGLVGAILRNRCGGCLTESLTEPDKFPGWVFW